MNIDVVNLTERSSSQRWNRVCVGDLFERNKWSQPDKIAIIGAKGAVAYPTNARLSYVEADKVTNRISQALLAEGLNRGDRVLLICENSVEAILAKFGMAKAGLVAVPLNPAMAEDVAEYLIELAQPRFAIIDDEFVPKFGPLLDTVQLEHVIVPVTTEAPAHVADFQAWYTNQPDVEPTTVVDGNDIWQILFTSGTTSMPKGVMISHTAQHLSSYSFGMTSTRGLRSEADLVVACFLPVVYHGSDVTMTQAFLTGGTLVIGRKFDPRLFAETIASEQVTAFFAGTPSMLERIIEPLEAQQQSLKTTVVSFGWAVLPPSLLQRCKDLFGSETKFIGIMGMTECISAHRFDVITHEQVYAEHGVSRNYVGRPNPILSAKIVDQETGEEITEPHQVGEVVYRSPGMMAGYYKNEQATLEATAGGWFHSEDLVSQDEDGLRIMVDRTKDIVKTGGENVSSMRVEAALREHPAVADVAVVGLPDSQWGEAVTAFIVPKPRHAVDTDSIKNFASQTLSKIEVPKKVLVVESLPYGVGGKVQKFKLKAAVGNPLN